MSHRGPPKWNDEIIESEVRAIADRLKHFPSASELKGEGRNDLCCAITRSGGLLKWSERIGVPRVHSDSDTGWDGEVAFVNLALSQGIAAERTTHVKHPFDVLLDDVLRIDVKSAKRACYSPDPKHQYHAWYYRIGKAPQADVVVLYQLDTSDFYGVPWRIVPNTNISMSAAGGKYAQFKNNWPLIRQLISTRKREHYQFCSGGRSPVAAAS